jgi:hypothetical protein
LLRNGVESLVKDKSGLSEVAKSPLPAMGVRLLKCVVKAFMRSSDTVGDAKEWKSLRGAAKRYKGELKICGILKKN